jgi:hypothetical protein
MVCSPWSTAFHWLGHPWVPDRSKMASQALPVNQVNIKPFLTGHIPTSVKLSNVTLFHLSPATPLVFFWGQNSPCVHRVPCMYTKPGICSFIFRRWIFFLFFRSLFSVPGSEKMSIDTQYTYIPYHTIPYHTYTQTYITLHYIALHLHLRLRLRLHLHLHYLHTYMIAVHHANPFWLVQVHNNQGF